MVVGTTSNAGKSLLCAALCRIFSRQGLRVTPFKGQNMALNSYVTRSDTSDRTELDETGNEIGGEIGYAQAVQAWAAKVEATVEMNPILLKPQGDMTSQVIFLGKAVGVTQAADYYRDYFEPGWQCIQDSLAKLSQKFDLAICEGAGSPAEINLKHRDLTNMRVALHLNAATILVVNIELGGAFAHVVGTLALLTEAERSLIKGIVINNFRGQRSLLDPGIEWLEDYTGIPVIGVIPHLDIAFPAEDSVNLLERRSRLSPAEIKIAVLRLPRISNFTDFDPLIAEPTVDLRYVMPQDRLGNPDVLIIPGSKTTIPDLLALKESGMFEQIQAYARSQGTVLGICGGLQMLGQTISDPKGLEGKPGNYEGLGLLPLATLIGGDKVLRQRQVIAKYPLTANTSGYEIHQGKSSLTKDSQTHAIFDDPELGMVTSDRQIWGTYLHGLFDNGIWRRAWLNLLRHPKGLTTLPIEIGNYQEQRELILDQLADAIASNLNLDFLDI